MEKLLIIGAGGHGKVVADTALEAQRWKDICFLDDDNTSKDNLYRILGNIDQLPAFITEFEVVVAIGNNKMREQILLWAIELGCSIGIVVHPKAFISRSVNIGVGVVVFAHAVVNVQADIGMGCIVNTGAIVEHDCVLDSCVHISPNAVLAGGVKIGKCSWVGMGTSIIENINVGKNVIIGAGSVVINDICDSIVVVGSPAGVIKNNER
ncbi:MAG: acetyltransferase [Coxiellaceae bacterium]|jgi:sugar O-acyltransferase (sialic acid O-acetyltransferase NeuD family)|nr:acetyltransferase [Coxiellaceae bacterium]